VVNPLRLDEYWVHADGLGRVPTNFWRERWPLLREQQGKPGAIIGDGDRN